MRFIDLFAGVGGFRLGMERAGHECVWSCEWDKYARMTYEKNFGRAPEGADIREVDTSTIPDHDIICGGFPCQSFSIAGKRGGFSDTRGTLFFEIMRIAKDKRTPYLFLENVKGLLSHDDGRTFGTILSTLDECGYDAEWQVCNSKFFGVPQNRERVFIIGHLRGVSRPKIFPLTKSDARDSQTQGEAQGEGERVRGEDSQVASTLAKRDYKGGNNLIQLNNPVHSNKIVVVGNNVPSGHEAGNVYDPNGIAPTVRENHGKITKIITHSLQTRNPNRPSLKYSSGGSGHLCKDDGMAYCLDSGNSQAIEKGTIIRRLTPLECERLQGFPEGHTEGVSDRQRYRQMGNAVTTNVIYEIARRLPR